MIVLVCGGREYNDYKTLNDTLDALHNDSPFTCLIEGGAKGADELARNWAFLKQIGVMTFLPDWKQHGKSAGPIRNQRMLDEKPDIVVAFPGGRGTADMVHRAKLACLNIIVVAQPVQEGVSDDD